MSERRRRLTADNRRGLVDELVVLEGRHHEEGKVHATCHVALENGIAHMPAPHWQALALALLEVATAHDRPPRVACKHPSGRFNLVVEVHNASESRDPTDDVHEHFDLPRIDVLAVAGDMPTAREDQARPRIRIVKNRLCRSRCVMVDAHRGEHDEHPVAPGYGALDDLAVIRRSRNDSNAPLEGIELLHAALAAHADHRIAPIQRVLHHVDSELPRGPDDADLHHVRQAYSWVTPSAVRNDAPAFTLSRLSTELRPGMLIGDRYRRARLPQVLDTRDAPFFWRDLDASLG